MLEDIQIEKLRCEMKRILIIYVVIILVTAFTSVFAQDYGNDYYNNDGGNVSGVFYSSLSPYGTWIQLDNGMTVWRPSHLSYGWLPYRDGRWVWTDDGWYWDSYEPFGYIVYHYGRWYNDNYYGWIWVPDDQWAPAWVQWRYDNDYIGWAPLPPYAAFSMSLGIDFTYNYVTPYSCWNFVGYRYFCDPNPYHYYVTDRIKYRIYSDSRFRTNYGYSDGRVINRGVDVDYIRQRSGGRIVESRIERVGNSRDLGGDRGRNPGIVRAFVPPRAELVRGAGRNINIQRGVRSSTLDASRVELFRNPSRSDNTGRINSQPENRNNPWQLRDNRPENRTVNPRLPENVRPNNRDSNPWQPNNVRPENKDQNPWRPQVNKPENRNSNPLDKRNYTPQKRNEAPQQRNNSPQIRRETPVRQAPQVRRENNNGNRGNDKKVERGRGR